MVTKRMSFPVVAVDPSAIQEADVVIASEGPSVSPVIVFGREAIASLATAPERNLSYLVVHLTPGYGQLERLVALVAAVKGRNEMEDWWPGR